MIDKNTTEHKGKKLTGKVVSCKMNKTIVVLVERKVKHETYGKYVRCSTKIHAHDENSLCKLGDLVTISECRPISKTKRWTVLPSKEKE